MPPRKEEPHHNLYLKACSAVGDVRATLLYVRLVERVRRTVAHEYGLALSSVVPRQTFISRIHGKADEERQSLHADECSFGQFHYSSVLYLSTLHDDFEGGRFVFSDRIGNGHDGRLLSPLEPASGSAVIFSSGWENMHYVEPLAGGTRLAVPIFFVTRDEDERRGSHDDAVIADTLWRTLLMPQTEEDCQQFMREWHELLS